MSAVLNEMNAIEEKIVPFQADMPSPTMTHFQLYENLNFISELKFEKDRITIGRSRKADLFLDHQAVADVHAFVNFDGQQAVLTNRYPQDGLRLNGMPVHTAPLNDEDVIVIGPFALKVRVKERPFIPLDDGQTSYAIRLVNRYGSTEAMQSAAIRMARVFRTGLENIRPLLAKDHVVVKRGLSGLEAAQIQNTLLKAGIICDVQIEAQKKSGPPADKPVKKDDQRSMVTASERTPAIVRPESASPADVAATPSAAMENASADNLSPAVPSPVESVSFPQGFFPVDEEPDENGDVWETPFCLNQILTSVGTPCAEENTTTHLQVIKSMGNVVVDAVSLSAKQPYRIEAGGHRVDLVRYVKDQAVVSLLESAGGVVLNASGSITADLNSYKTEAYRSGKKQSEYEIPLPEGGAVVIDDGACQYRIERVHYAISPPITPVPATKTMVWQHWAVSLGLHVLLFGFIFVVSFFQSPPAQKPELHFVKIDKSMLQLEKPVVKPAPKKILPPNPPVQKAKPAVKPSPARKRQQKVNQSVATAKPAKNKKKSGSGTESSKHPKAGGGFGQGNIKNRNINQTGLLSVLGGASTTGPSAAMVAVTNLDAVTVPGATQKNFSVGGLKGALGDGKISVATGQIVQTKGSSQVLRSGGARGKGEVAALQRGSTGKKKVQAMVTARMNRTVKIEGGMSREMVKRVIDQHLDEITYCYETALMTNPSILGRIVYEWKILKDGRVGEIRIVASSVNSNQIHGCIKSAIKSWQFPKPVGTEVIVSYPFVFDLVSF